MVSGTRSLGNKRQILWQAASYVAIFIASVAWVGWGPP